MSINYVDGKDKRHMFVTKIQKKKKSVEIIEKKNKTSKIDCNFYN